MIRKNAVESILAERDILISVRNPFVVSRPYNFQHKLNLACKNNFLLFTVNRSGFSTPSQVGKIFTWSWST